MLLYFDDSSIHFSFESENGLPKNLMVEGNKYVFPTTLDGFLVKLDMDIKTISKWYQNKYVMDIW